MLGIQISLDGKRFVTLYGVVLGELECEPDVAIGVFRDYIEEFKGISDKVRHWANSDKRVKSCNIQGSEILIFTYSPMDMREAISTVIFPMDVNRLSLVRIVCKGCYVVKPSAIYTLRDMRAIGVIK